MEINTTGDKIKEMLTIACACKNTMYFKSEPDKLYIYSLDASNSSMIIAQFDKEYFNTYDLGERTMAFAHDAFDTILKRVKKNDARIIFSEYDAEFIEKNTHWSVPILGDGNDKRMPNPSFETGISFKVDVSNFQEEMTRVRDGGSNIRFEMTADFVKLCGGDFDKRDAIFSILKKEELKEYNFQPYNGETKATVTFSTSFFDVLKIIPADADLEIRVDKGMPIRIIVACKNLKYQYLIAPIIAEGDE